MSELEPKKKPLWRFALYGVHWIIIANFVFEMVYAGTMVFHVLRPKGVTGPLASKALEIPHELMVTRRLYAIEFWIACGGLAIYLALTEIAPRLKQLRSSGSDDERRPGHRSRIVQDD